MVTVPAKHKTNDDLKLLIISLISYLDVNKETSHAISSLSSRFFIKRRRLYDIMNVFASVGCCQKSYLDSIIWSGKESITKEIAKIRAFRKIDEAKSLDELFPVDGCIGISNLTTSFLMLYLAIGRNCLDVRFVSKFFSRNTSREKTTLCKLYQISYILSTVGVTSRTNQVCEVMLNPPYFQAEAKGEKETPMSISFLLSRPQESTKEGIRQRRAKEFDDFIAGTKDSEACQLKPQSDFFA